MHAQKLMVGRAAGKAWYRRESWRWAAKQLAAVTAGMLK